MTERHTVYITRETEIEVEVEIVRGTSNTWFEQGTPDEGCVLNASTRITEEEEAEAVEIAMLKPTPEPEPWPEPEPDDDHKNRPF